jgi:hypothetical protein
VDKKEEMVIKISKQKEFTEILTTGQRTWRKPESSQWLIM